jgi:hypothetical protein
MRQMTAMEEFIVDTVFKQIKGIHKKQMIENERRKILAMADHALHAAVEGSEQCGGKKVPARRALQVKETV